MGCQKKIAEMIVNAGADYVLAVKDNQKELKESIDFWLNEDNRLYLGQGRRYTTEETGHGRYEFRECVVVDNSDIARLSYKDWKGLRTMAKITSTRRVGTQEPTVETRYYISSLEADPKLIMESVRTHWQVENNLHWMLDVAFREDYTRKTDNAAINLSLINKVILTMLKQTKRKEGLASRRKFCGWDENFRDEVLGIKFID
jgi:predicted transposase YbfD/YdcC